MVEDAAWLRKKHDSTHINVAELEAIIRGINLATQWNLTKLEVVTDSATAYGWMTSLLTKDHRIKVHGLGEALVHSRLSLLGDLIQEHGLTVDMRLVASRHNCADRLTRVSRKWLEPVPIAAISASGGEGKSCAEGDKLVEIQRIHKWNHLGVDRTMFGGTAVSP